MYYCELTAIILSQHAGHDKGKLPDFAAFKIISLIIAVPYGKAFLRERSVAHYRGKQLGLFHTREKYPRAAAAVRHFGALLVAVDIVDITATALGVALAEVLAGTDELTYGHAGN